MNKVPAGSFVILSGPLLTLELPRTTTLRGGLLPVQLTTAGRLSEVTKDETIRLPILYPQTRSIALDLCQMCATTKDDRGGSTRILVPN